MSSQVRACCLVPERRLPALALPPGCIFTARLKPLTWLGRTRRLQ